MWRDWFEMPPWLEATRYQHGGWRSYELVASKHSKIQDEFKFLGLVWTCPTFSHWWSIQRLSPREGLQNLCNVCLKENSRNLSGAETTLLRWGYACVVSVSRFALLRAFVLISAWSQSLNFTWHPSNLRQKGSPHFSMLFALVCCVFLFRFQWCLHFHFRTALAHRVPLLIWRLYTFIYAAMTQRVSFIFPGVVCVKFVNRQAKVGKLSNQQVCL